MQRILFSAEIEMDLNAYRQRTQIRHRSDTIPTQVGAYWVQKKTKPRRHVAECRFVETGAYSDTLDMIRHDFDIGGFPDVVRIEWVTRKVYIRFLYDPSHCTLE